MTAARRQRSVAGMSGLFILLLLGLPLLCSSSGTDDGSPATIKSWRLAFTRGSDIWVSNGDGTDQKLLIENGQNPSWSPDKSLIAFVRENNIWMANADGSNQQAVASGARRDERISRLSVSHASISISWHPTGNLITFSHPEAFKIERTGLAGVVSTGEAATNAVTGNSIVDVYLGGTGTNRVAMRYDVFAGGTGFHFTDHAHPAWSPSGEQLAFTRYGDIWIARAGTGSEGAPRTGWEAKRLAAVASYDEPTNRGSRMNCGATHLAWHPDERELAYGYDRLQGSGANEIHLLNIKSGKDSIIVKDALHPSFSPDGNVIVYWTYSKEQCGSGICICTVPLNGKNGRKIISNARDPVW